MKCEDNDISVSLLRSSFAFLSLRMKMDRRNYINKVYYYDQTLVIAPINLKSLNSSTLNQYCWCVIIVLF
jgi:hypothetical protein